MKTYTLCTALAVATSFVLSASAAKEAPLAEPAPAEAAPALSQGLADLLPAELIKADGSKVAAAELAGKPLVGIYFSAHWCPPCRGFTPSLVKFRDANEKDFEVVFVSSDKDAEAMKGYMSEYKMKWLGVPKGAPQERALSKKYGVRGIPTLVILKADGTMVTKDGRADVSKDPEGAVAKWKSS